jgi:large repetitive protein
MGVSRASGCWLFLAVVGCTSAPAPAPPLVPVTTSAPFDVSAVIRQVQRSFREDGARWTTAGRGWALRTSEEGLELTAIHRPDAPLSPGLVGPQRRVESGAIRLGPTRLERGGWKQTTAGVKAQRAHDGTLERKGDGFIERLENAEVGLEQSWRFESAPGAHGDLVLTIPVTGVTHRGATSTGAHLVDAPSGLGFRIGHGTFIDAAGVETAVPVSFEAGVLVLRVPEAVLERSLFPAVLDPVISPEFELDQPIARVGVDTQDGPAIASNGSSYLVVWSDSGHNLTNPTILAVRVDNQGSLLERVPLVLSASSTEIGILPNVASNGTDYLVVWTGSRLAATRVSAQGVVLDEQPFAVSTGQVRWRQYASVASNGADYLVAWSGANAARVTATGRVLDPGGLDFGEQLPAPWISQEDPPAIASNGSSYLVMWTRRGRSPPDGSVIEYLQTASVLFDGGIRHDAGVVVEGPWLELYAHPTLVHSGDGFLASWQEHSAPGVFATKARSVSASGEALGTPFVVSEDWCDRRTQLALASGEFLAAWSDCTALVRTARLSPDGSVAVNPGFLGAASTDDVVGIASTGSRVLLAWSDSDLAMARLVDATGQPLDAGFQLSRPPNSQLSPSVATIEGDSLVVWLDDRDSWIQGGIYGVRVLRDGGLPDPSGIALSLRPTAQAFPTVTSNRSTYFVTWTQYTWPQPRLSIYGTRVSREGVVLDDGGILVAGNLDAGSVYMSSVASNGTDYLVAWGEGPPSRFPTSIQLARVSATGAVLDPAPLRPGRPGLSGEAPGIASLGSDYLVVWSSWSPDGGADVTGTRVTGSGAMLDPNGLELAAGPLHELSPRVASNGVSYLVTWDESAQPSTRFWEPPYELDRERDRIKAVLLSNTGSRFDAGTLLLSPDTGERSSVAVASDGTDYLVSWQDRRSGGSFDVYGARVTGDGMAQDDGGFVLAGGYRDQLVPALSAIGGGRYLLAYNQRVLQEFPRRVKARFVQFNGPPVPRNLALTMPEDTALNITLVATDPENEPITFSIRRAPAHGRLSGTPPQLVYTPEADFNGTDSFEYRASDGQSTSRPGLVTLAVTPVNDAPVVEDTSLTFLQGQPLSLPIAARDADGDVLQYTLLTSPPVGLLTGAIPTFSWQAPAGFRGAASLRFRVSDGTDAREGTVRWTVTNVAPTVTASASASTTTEGERVQFFATASDPGQDALQLAWNFGDGTRSDDLAPFHVFERPGRFRVTVTASDGLAQASSVVDVEVGNGAPRLTVSLPVTADEGAAVSMRAEVRDSQTTPATVTWDFGDGTPVAQGDSVTHVFPDDGRFSVTVTATDTQGATRQVVREVTVFNVAPTPAPQALLPATPGTRVTTTLSATDPAGAKDPLSWTLVQGPGALSADGQYTWEPRGDDVGRFSIEARVADDDTGAAVVRFEVQVAPSPTPVGCTCTSFTPGPFLLVAVGLLLARRSRPG